MGNENAATDCNETLSPLRADGITPARRIYNQWVANETLEDFALRFTARRARRWSAGWVANTALGSISFLALEAIGGTLTLIYGFENAAVAIVIVGAILFITGLPISYHAAKAGVDIDLLTRGAGFGYLGSTVTSLIYASFTFIFFALEATILSLALELCFGIPLGIGYLLNALVVIPLVTHGFTRIGLFQTWTQPFWIILHALPFLFLAFSGASLNPWFEHQGELGSPFGGIDPVLCAAAAGVASSLMAQIGEQVDFLRFLPEPKTRRERFSWWAALLAAGPGWAVLGTAKMLAGSFLAVLVLQTGGSPEAAADPTKMYLQAFEEGLNAEIALLVTGLFVILAQLKINVTNAYAGSIAWSNFFSRLTHSHPGRVVWLIFNVAIAMLLMLFGVFEAIEKTLAIYAHVAVAWIAAIFADLTINRPLGLRPKRIEFRRAYLYDINPVGTIAMATATVLSLAAFLGLFGDTAEAFSTLIALVTALLMTPLLAALTGGRFYLARQPEPIREQRETACTICGHRFDAEDLIQCPFHAGTICSLCCSLESRCGDVCKPEGRFDQQFDRAASQVLPPSALAFLASRYGTFAKVAGALLLVIGVIFFAIYQQAVEELPDHASVLSESLALAFVFLIIIVGITAWLHTLARESTVLATRERERQTSRLQAEIRAHQRTDEELQRAKEMAEAANEAKSRYLVGISHELRTPLNAILGYAQLLESDPSMPEHRRPGVKIIRRSSEHLADLIESLLDISKIEAGRLVIERRETDFAELLEQMANIFRMEAEENGLDFHFEPAPDLPRLVITDERHLRQILMNLLSNAVRYTSTGHVRFRIDHKTDIATILIEDTGRGIPKAAQERIFEPFERLEDPSAPVPGTGLGLTIVKLLVDMQGGDLNLESRPGKGTLFRIRLMLPRLDQAVSTEPKKRIFGYLGERQRILIVDDNLEHRTLLEDLLRPLGFELAMAESGEAALPIVDAVDIDLALVDVAMPGMSGWTLATILRRERSLALPIIMVSAHAGDAAKAHDRVADHDDFLTKPVNIEQLLARLERYLNLTWLHDETIVSKGEDHLPHPEAPGHILERMQAMVEIGHVRGAEQLLDEVTITGKGVDRFVQDARQHLADVDLDGLTSLIRETRHG
ncbi:MAG: ATP-binding protein [Pseudomonadota bacterium]